MTKSCFNCRNACLAPEIPAVWYYSDGSGDPGEPAHLEECLCEEVPVQLFEEEDLTEEELASKCGHYDPLTIEKCEQCGAEINQPQHSWTLWGVGHVIVPVCSEKCKKAYEDGFFESLGMLNYCN